MTRLCLFLVVSLLAQHTFGAEAPSWISETLYASGKMNTVIAVIMVLMLSLLVWMFILDRRIKKLEDK